MSKNSAIRDLRLIKETKKLSSKNPQKKKISGKSEKLINNFEPKRLMKQSPNTSKKLIKWNSNLNFHVATELRRFMVGKSSGSNSKLRHRAKPRKIHSSNRNNPPQNRILKAKRSLPGLSKKPSQNNLLPRKTMCNKDDSELFNHFKSIITQNYRNPDPILSAKHKKYSSAGQFILKNSVKIPKLNLKDVIHPDEYQAENNIFEENSHSEYTPTDNLSDYTGSDISENEVYSPQFHHRKIESLI